MNDVVIIAGSAEAHALSQALPGARVCLVTPERVRRKWARTPREGPLSADWLQSIGARLVVDASHPCDSETAFAIRATARKAGIAHLQLVRPAWRAGRRDTWLRLAQVRDAARILPPGARVLVTTGRAAVPELRAVRAEIVMRRIAPLADTFPLPRGRFLCAEGPFSVVDEIRLLRKERIDWLLVHNAGGAGGWPKLEAARRLHLPVAMVDRPRRPGGPLVRTVKEAKAWITRNLT